MKKKKINLSNFENKFSISGEKISVSLYKWEYIFLMQFTKHVFKLNLSNFTLKIQ